nr:hypothetical protein K-LCC10_0194 [Kaumoebavirus]
MTHNIFKGELPYISASLTRAFDHLQIYMRPNYITVWADGVCLVHFDIQDCFTHMLVGPLAIVADQACDILLALIHLIQYHPALTPYHAFLTAANN